MMVIQAEPSAGDWACSRKDALLRFAMSETFFELRKSLGVAIGVIMKKLLSIVIVMGMCAFSAPAAKAVSTRPRSKMRAKKLGGPRRPNLLRQLVRVRSVQRHELSGRCPLKSRTFWFRGCFRIVQSRFLMSVLGIDSARVAKLREDAREIVAVGAHDSFHTRDRGAGVFAF
jgi:hypothetical protein